MTLRKTPRGSAQADVTSHRPRHPTPKGLIHPLRFALVRDPRTGIARLAPASFLALVVVVATAPGALTPHVSHEPGRVSAANSDVAPSESDAASPLVARAVLIQQSAPFVGVPLNVSLVANATGGSPPYIESWNFGDGSPTGFGGLVSHEYPGAGSFLVLLMVVDALGVHASSTIIVGTEDYGTPGSADVYESTQLATAGANASPIDFRAAPPVTTAYTVAHYQWDFGDGSSSTVSDPVHSFAEAGNYLVGVTVEFNMTFPSQPNQSWWNATYHLNEVAVAPGSEPPIATAILNATSRGNYCDGQASLTLALLADAVGGKGTYSYDWGIQGEGPQPQLSGLNLSTLAPGRYNISLTVSDASGLTATTSSVVEITGVTTPAQACQQPLLYSPYLVFLTASGIAALCVTVGIALIRRRSRRRGSFDFPH